MKNINTHFVMNNYNKMNILNKKLTSSHLPQNSRFYAIVFSFFLV